MAEESRSTLPRHELAEAVVADLVEAAAADMVEDEEVTVEAAVVTAVAVVVAAMVVTMTAENKPGTSAHRAQRRVCC